MEIDGEIVGLTDDLHGRGFIYNGHIHNADDTSTQSVMMELSKRNNNTRVVCIGADDTDGDGSRVVIITPEAFITILST